MTLSPSTRRRIVWPAAYVGAAAMIGAVLVLAAAVPAPAAPVPRYGGVLRVATTASPPTLDPHMVTHIATREVGLHVFEQLVAFNDRFEVVPQLASGWDVSADGLTYTFHLRRGVHFHNGKEMSATDVKASVDRFRQVSARRQELDMVASLDVLDPYTVRFRLTRPNAAFLATLASPIAQLAILPAEAVAGRKANEAELIGTGPFRFVEWIPDRWVRLARFDGYQPPPGPPSGFSGGRVAYLDEIRFIPVPEPGARVAGLETGEYDFADFLPANSVPGLQQTPGVEVVQLAPYTWVAIYFNHSGIFRNLKMRQAVQAALNMDEVALVGGEGAGRVDPGFYFKEQFWHSTAGAEYYNQKNPEKARQLLKEGGYKGEPVVLVTNTSYDYMYKSALAIHQQLRKIGLNVKMEVYDWPGALAVRKDLSKWDLFFSSHSTRFDPTANDFYFMPETTFFAYDNPKAAALIQQGQVEGELQRRYAIYSDLQRLLYEDAAWLKLFDLNVFEGYRTRVKGYVPWVLVRFWNVWLEP